MKKFLFNFLFITLFFCVIPCLKADTIRMMQYNLMYYTYEGVAECNVNTNNLDSKDAHLKTIIDYAKPDILCVNELGSSMQYTDRIMNNVLNTDGIDYYQHCPLTNYSGGSLANMLFYNSQTMGFHSHFYITTSYRDINAYKMYYKSNELLHGDTAFITFIIAHLKAGSGETNEQSRLVQTQRLMNKLLSLGVADNYVFSGDFNTTKSTEPGYDHLINYSNTLFRFHDPIDKPGNWNSNPAFSNIHTQSTHSNSNGCFSTGGMDDRFDIILVSPYIYYGTNKVKSLPSTYQALGQDGNRCCNSSLISPANNSVPSEVINALYNMSDHLPVVLDFAVEATTGIVSYKPDFYAHVTNPVSETAHVTIETPTADNFIFEIYSIEGKLLKSKSQFVDQGISNISFEFPYVPSLYILKITNSSHETVVKKILK